MNGTMNVIRKLRAVTWMRVLAITATAVFVAVMCLMEQIRSLV